MPEFIIRVENVSDKAKTLRMDSLAPTVLAAQPKRKRVFQASDGPSFALVTREAFWIGGPDGGPRTESQGVAQAVPYAWRLTAPRALEKFVTLQPNEAFDLHISFKLPQGEYEFLAGYGGGVHHG